MALFGASVLLLLGFIYWSTAAYLTQQTDQTIEAEIADLAERYPLILTCAKNTLFCESQHRALPSLRRQSLEPEVEIHPVAAAERGIRAGDWVFIETPAGRVHARARLGTAGVRVPGHTRWGLLREVQSSKCKVQSGKVS